MPSQKNTQTNLIGNSIFFTVTVVSSLLLAILTMACFLKTQGLPLRIPFVKGLVAINLTVQSFHFAAEKKTSDWSLGSLLSRVWQQPTSLYKTFLEKKQQCKWGPFVKDHFLYKFFLSKNAFWVLPFIKASLYKFFLSKCFFGLSLLSRHLCTNSFCQRMLLVFCLLSRHHCTNSFCQRMLQKPFVKASALLSRAPTPQ